MCRYLLTIPLFQERNDAFKSSNRGSKKLKRQETVKDSSQSVAAPTSSRIAGPMDEAKALGILGFVNTRWLDKSQFNPKNELDKAHYAKTSIVLEKKRKEEEENEKKEKEGKKKKSNVNKALGHVSH